MLTLKDIVVGAVWCVCVMAVALLLNVLERRRQARLAARECPRCAKPAKKPAVSKGTLEEVEHLNCSHCGLHAVRRTYTDTVKVYRGEWLDRYSHEAVVPRR